MGERLFAAGGFVGSGDDGVEAAARGPFGGEGHGAGFKGLDEVVEDAVGDVFVKDAALAKGLEVELVGFEFDAEFVGDVGEADGAEVGLAGHGADGGELRGDVLDFVVALEVGVGERFEEGGVAGGSVGHDFSRREGRKHKGHKEHEGPRRGVF